MPITTRRPIDGGKLRALREGRYMSQKELAESCAERGSQATQSQISHLENGRIRNPYMPLVLALADSLNVGIDDLLEEAS